MDQLENSSRYSLVQKVKQIAESKIEWIREAGGEICFHALPAT